MRAALPAFRRLPPSSPEATPKWNAYTAYHRLLPTRTAAETRSKTTGRWAGCFAALVPGPMLQAAATGRWAGCSAALVPGPMLQAAATGRWAGCSAALVSMLPAAGSSTTLPAAAVPMTSSGRAHLARSDWWGQLGRRGRRGQTPRLGSWSPWQSSSFVGVRCRRSHSHSFCPSRSGMPFCKSPLGRP